jgi:hypothetical protein
MSLEDNLCVFILDVHLSKSSIYLPLISSASDDILDIRDMIKQAVGVKF